MTPENEMRNSILITCHYPDLGSASDWLKRISLARITRSTTQMWVVTGHQYGISAPVPQTSLRGKTFSLGPGNEVVGGGGGESKNGVIKQKQMTSPGSLHAPIIFPSYSSNAELGPKLGN